MTTARLMLLVPTGPDAVTWESYYQRLPWGRRSIHFSPGYARAQEISGDDAYCAVIQKGGDFLMQPFMVRRDGSAESLYGYGGPVGPAPAGKDALKLFAELEQAMDGSRKGLGIICERVVLTPRLAEEQLKLYASVGVNGRLLKQVVVVSANGPSLTEKRAYAVSKARRDGIEVGRSTSRGQSLTRFCELYSATMDRVGAAPRWRHQREYFEAHFTELRHKVVLIEATMPMSSGGRTVGTIVSSALVLIDGAEAQYQFAGNSGVSGASDLVILEAANVAHAAGCVTLDLGGGVTAAPDDSVYWYKGTFSASRRSVWVVERIYNQAAYDKACEGHPPTPFFPPWRAAAGIHQSIGGAA